ncbi:MAG: glycoside hydrolase family 140 protein [Salinivirgaceae bacterium]|jgi:hypothetical protein|nr:glycoside hydrolase family 140 protein [Salinivirgaceae bacterium]
MRLKFLIALIALTCTSAFGQNIRQNGRLKVTANGHSLCQEDGTPFFWLGDTAWELFHRLNLGEISTYLENRKQKGFNVIQAVIIAEFDGLRKPNQYGEVPLENMDPTTPNEKYFQLVDSVVKLASSKELYMGLLPTWGDKVSKLSGLGPVVFNPKNAYSYGMWLGKRYKDDANIIWILGGDRPVMIDSKSDWRPIWHAMANGILDGTNHKALITYHPWMGNLSSSQYIHNEVWLDFNMIQSGHGEHDFHVWNLVQRDWNLKPTKPTLDAEPNYEDHPVHWNPENGYFRDYDVRKQTYRSVFAGACGVTYGHHSVWQFYSSREKKLLNADRFWTEAIDRPGAFQVGYLKKLIESRPQLNRVPDQSLILKGQGEKGEYICAFRDSIASYMMVYMPVGKAITINTAIIKSKKIKVGWFNPRTAATINKGIIANKASIEFTSPTVGNENDWVLVVDNYKMKRTFK